MAFMLLGAAGCSRVVGFECREGLVARDGRCVAESSLPDGGTGDGAIRLDGALADGEVLDGRFRGDGSNGLRDGEVPDGEVLDGGVGDGSMGDGGGADVFVHSIITFSAEQLADTSGAGRRRRAALEMLGTPEQVGPLFNRVQPKLAVYYHYTRDSTIVPRTRAVYSGPLELAEDLMQITIGERIAVNRRTPP